jgi:hypothetical protein
MKNKMLKITNPQGGEEGKGGVKCPYMAAAERDHLLFLSEKEVLPSSPIVYSKKIKNPPSVLIRHRSVAGIPFLPQISTQDLE